MNTGNKDYINDGCSGAELWGNQLKNKKENEEKKRKDDGSWMTLGSKQREEEKGKND